MADLGIDRLNAQDTLMKSFAPKLHGFIRDPESPNATIRSELKPSAALDWSPKLVQLVGVNDLNIMFLLLRQSELPKKEYRTLRRRISTYISDNSQIPPHPLGNLDGRDHSLRTSGNPPRRGPDLYHIHP